MTAAPDAGQERVATAQDFLLAAQVTVRPDREYIAGSSLAMDGSTVCPAWMERAERKCGKPAEVLLCAQHERVARRRLETKARDQALARRKADEHRAAKVPGWRAELADVEQEIAREQARLSPALDRAAVGGNVHPSVARRQERANERDARIGARLRQLNRRAADLRDRIGDTP